MTHIDSSSLPVLYYCGRVESDENKTQGGPDPVHPPIFLGRRLILIDDKNPKTKHAKLKPDNKVQRASPD